MKRYIIPIIIIALSLSCRKELDIKIPNNDRKIVMNTVAIADSNFSATIFRSNHVQDKQMDLLYLNNATVSVYDNGAMLEELKLDSLGVYSSSNAVVQEGHDYEVKVSVPNLISVSAKAKVLPEIPIISVDSVGWYEEENYYYYDYYDEDEKPNIYTVFEVKFKDIPNEKNYYRLNINTPLYVDTSRYYDNELDSLIINVSYRTVSNSSNDQSIEVWSWMDDYYYFSDILFDGDEYGFSINVMMPEDMSNIIGELSVTLEHISYEFYVYMKSIDMQSETQDMELFYQAASVYNNVENGFGIFGTANANKMVVE